MSDATSFAVPLPFDSRLAGTAEALPVEVDLNATYRYLFAPQRWLVGLGTCVKGGLLLVAGVFLLFQVSSTQNLKVQLVITGTLLTVGGLALLTTSLSDFFGGLQIDRSGIRARLGLTTFSAPWSEVEQWRVTENAAKIAEFPSVQVWLSGTSHPRTIPGGRLSRTDHACIQQLFQTFAPGKEKAQGR